MLKAYGDISGHYHQVSNSPTCEEVKAAAVAGPSTLDHWAFPTEVRVSATAIAAGYVGETETASAVFSPSLPC